MLFEKGGDREAETGRTKEVSGLRLPLKIIALALARMLELGLKQGGARWE